MSLRSTQYGRSAKPKEGSVVAEPTAGIAVFSRASSAPQALARRARVILRAAFDFNSDGLLDLDDQRTWVKDVAHTWFGDANVGGEFSSTDLVDVLVAGQYDDRSSLLAVIALAGSFSNPFARVRTGRR